MFSNLISPALAIKSMFCDNQTGYIKVYVTDKDGHDYFSDDNLFYCLVKTYGYLGKNNPYYNLIFGDSFSQEILRILIFS